MQSFIPATLACAPRLVFATLIGITIAHPITLRLFEPEILDKIAEDTEAERRKIAINRDNALGTARAQVQQAKQALPEWSAVDQATRQRNEAGVNVNRCEADLVRNQHDYLCEADGTCGRERLDMPMSKQKEAAYRETVTRCQLSGAQVQQATLLLTQAEQKLSVATQDLEALVRRQSESIEIDYQRAIKRLSHRGERRSSRVRKRSEKLAMIGQRRPSHDCSSQHCFFGWR